MNNKLTGILLHGIITVVYYVPIFKLLQWIFANLPANLVMDLMATIMYVMGFMVCIGLGDRTVAWIKGKL